MVGDDRCGGRLGVSGPAHIHHRRLVASAVSLFDRIRIIPIRVLRGVERELSIGAGQRLGVTTTDADGGMGLAIATDVQ